MAKSLLDQLKNAGLVDEKRVKQAKKQKHQQLKRQGGGGKQAVDENRLRAEQARAEQARRDRELNRQRKAAAEEKALAAQIKQLVTTNRIADHEGEIAYHFSDGPKVQRLYLTQKIQQGLSRGRLAIVKLEGRYELVPATVAEKIRQRDAKAVILCHADERDQHTADEAYTDHPIPDDLTW